MTVSSKFRSAVNGGKGSETASTHSQCSNDNQRIYSETAKKLAKWDAIFLKDARKRIQGMIKGYEVSLTDAKDLVSFAPGTQIINPNSTLFISLLQRTGIRV